MSGPVLERPRVASPLKFDLTARPLSGPRTVPESVWSMAAGPDDSVYVVDVAREEVLRWSPGEGFFDVAGNGHRGFSGDGRPATKAEFNLTWGSALAVGRNGTLYICDSGNDRAVRPDGTVETIVGGGRTPLNGPSGLARSGSLGSGALLSGLAMGPDGELYIGADAGVYRLDASRLTRVVGVDPATYRWPPPPYDYDTPLPIRFDGATRLAFDGRGDLVVGSGDTYSAYELTAAGRRRGLGNIRGDGSVAPLAEAPNGEVLVGTGRGGASLEWLSPEGRFAPVPGLGDWDSLTSPLDKALGGKNYFRPSNGAAVNRAGVVFVDTDIGNAWTNVSAIVEVTPKAVVRAIWRA